MLSLPRIVVAVAVLATAACGAAPTAREDAQPHAQPGAQPQAAPLAWGQPEPATIPPDVTSLSMNAAGWDGGALLAGNDLDPQLITSTDLTTWRHTMPDDLDQYTYHPIAGYGPNAYVLGSNNDGVYVWRTQDGDTWARASVPDAFAADPYLSIAAGPKGVLIAGYDQDTATYADTGNTYASYRTWYSSDGTEFEPAGEVTASSIYQSDGVQLTATPDGFILASDARGGVHESADGRQWTLAAGLPDYPFDAVGMAHGTTVALTTWFAEDSVEEPGLSAYYHRAGDEQWSEGTIDLGKLPDVGVEPRAAQYAWGVHEWGDGFVAYGSTKGGAGFGAVWTSPDGSTWTRLSIKDGGFDKAPGVFAAIQAGDTTALLGMDTSINGPGLTVWRS